MTFDRTSAEQFILQGATIADIADRLNTSWAEAATYLAGLGVSPPRATSEAPPDTLVSRYLSLVGDGTHPTQEELLSEAGGTFGVPPGFSPRKIDLAAIYEHFHGPKAYIDPYNGQQTNRRVLLVNSSDVVPGKPRNFLVTNIESLSEQTIKERFCNWMRPICETFEVKVLDWRVRLKISRPYDRLVGGTYTTEYINGLMARWVTSPLETYQGSPEKEPVFTIKTPFVMAWWSWQQITHFGLLKGLIELDVQNTQDSHSCVLRDDDVANSIVGFCVKDTVGAPSIIVPATQVPGQFAPGSLITTR